MNDDQEPVWLTPFGLDRLRSELVELSGQRAEAVRRAREARSLGHRGRPRFGHGPGDEVKAIDDRMARLSDILERAEVARPDADTEAVEPGTLVTVKFLDFGIEETFLFGAREMAGDDIKVYSPQSPLGQAIDGAKRGETVTYTLPNGNDQKAEILEAVPYTG